MNIPEDGSDEGRAAGGRWRVDGHAARGGPWDDDVVDSRTADVLRGALRREAAAVEPAPDALLRIRARTGSESRRPTWVLPLAAAAAGIAVVGGVAWSAMDPTEAPTAAGAPTQSPTSPMTAPEPSAGTTPEGSSVAIPVYYIGEQPDPNGTGPAFRLFREFISSSSQQAPDLASRVDVALTQMFADTPLDPDYGVSAWPAGITVTSTAVDEATGVVTVDLAGAELTDSPDAGAPSVTAALQQLVFTATAAAAHSGFEPTGVTLLFDGEPAEVAGADPGVPLRRDPASFRADVWILDLDDGKTLSSPVSIDGEVRLADGQAARWEVLASGSVVTSGPLDASECCSWQPYGFAVGDLPPGDYVLRVSVVGAGSTETASDSKSFTVVPEVG